jgi:hypothetical protein
MLEPFIMDFVRKSVAEFCGELKLTCNKSQYNSFFQRWNDIVIEPTDLPDNYSLDELVQKKNIKFIEWLDVQKRILSNDANRKAWEIGLLQGYINKEKSNKLLENIVNNIKVPCRPPTAVMRLSSSCDEKISGSYIPCCGDSITPFQCKNVSDMIINVSLFFISGQLVGKPDNERYVGNQLVTAKTLHEQGIIQKLGFIHTYHYYDPKDRKTFIFKDNILPILNDADPENFAWYD